MPWGARPPFVPRRRERATGRPAPSRPRAFAVLGLGLAAVCLGALAFGFVSEIRSSGDGTGTRIPTTAAAERAALLAYAGGLEPLAEDGGRIVQLGLKAGVADLHERAYPDAQLADMARGWKRELGRIRGDVAALEAPAFLADAHFLHVQALDGYVAVADTLRAAARSDGAVRDDLIALAVSLGEGSDANYDRAGDIVDRHRTRLGLPVETYPWEGEDTNPNDRGES